MPCQITKVTWVPNGSVTGWVKLNSPTAKNSTAAIAPTTGRPLMRQPTTPVSRIASAHSAGMARRSATTAMSMCPTMPVIAMCA